MSNYQEFSDVRSPNFFTPEACLSYYGQPRDITGITIHWWGDPTAGYTWEGTRDYLSRPNGSSSAHDVVEAGRVAHLVDYANAAWHAGPGNPSTIGIECNPRASDEDYATIAELVANIRAQFPDKSLPLYPHAHWMPTTCPGTYDLPRIDALSRAHSVVLPTPPAPVIAPVVATVNAGGYVMDVLDLRNAATAPVLDKHVDNLQGLLLAAGYGPSGLVGANGLPDGIAGPVTRQYVGEWQVKTNTGDGAGNADYIVGAKTWQSLIEY